MTKDQVIQAIEERRINHKRLSEDTNDRVQYLVDKAISDAYAHCLKLVKKIER